MSAAPRAASVKILIAGGFGVGKTTMVSSISEVPALHTEEVVTELSTGIDDLSGIEDKKTTTVALDFGRLTIDRNLVLYLFGTPGQDRFWYVWDELARGALGAIVVTDTRRLEHSFAGIDFFERRGLPFTVAVNRFDDSPPYTVQQVRDALDLDPKVPVVPCDARDRASCRAVLMTLVEHLILRTTATAV
ncbi:ATP/GTP-binding protein [Nocardia sp. BMG51109]|uniref:GTP-binding protein n=1 Tax=Nocardia sp. BMG51109 TaxID=1056816 RepID=UPI0004644F16|nr:ATP/GTP-binding protein [Nocardia sp. BMG51109]